MALLGWRHRDIAAGTVLQGRRCRDGAAGTALQYADFLAPTAEVRGDLRFFDGLMGGRCHKAHPIHIRLGGPGRDVTEGEKQWGMQRGGDPGDPGVGSHTHTLTHVWRE